MEKVPVPARVPALEVTGTKSVAVDGTPRDGRGTVLISLDRAINGANLPAMTDRAVHDDKRRALAAPPPGHFNRRRALDPFFLFTCTLLALALAIQVFLMVWMDIF